MKRATVAIVTGFTKSPELFERSFAPLQALRRDGAIDRVLYVTWDDPALDPYVLPAAKLPSVELIRVPEGTHAGTLVQRTVRYQTHNLQQALERVTEETALVLKLRPDFIADANLLYEKIHGFDTLCALRSPEGFQDIPMPASPFSAKIWLPWADASLPFFYEDGAFLGLKSDVAKLATDEAERYLDGVTSRECGQFVHTLRYAPPFLDSFPIFKRYLREARYFPNRLAYRQAVNPSLTGAPFFWHLLIAHAWILTTNFHVDCGKQGEILFYPNAFNPNADWSSVGSLALAPPYDCVEGWRKMVEPGSMMSPVEADLGRVVDDQWARTLFEAPVDLPVETLRNVLKSVALYRHGVLDAAEDEFFRIAEKGYTDWVGRAA